ncbi:Gfo/Idh/MocA family oxidoreductase [Rugosimonospora acidiphila]|uniref:Gfo/Idh/MocA family oxidoreductase n=1 Tax=Rugosimonospora acidiphila TaxID=556531 RepID=A0ABP9RYU9_9ACTN
MLGAARIAPAALIKPARAVPDAMVAAVAARDPERARAFAARHSIPRVHPDYDQLLADPELDAVYIPTPNGLHARWTLAALAAGKHVLCEKPLTSNEDQAREVADAADAAGLVVMEAFHYRYHPVMARVRGLIDEGAIGAVRHVRATMCFPLPRFSDIRYRLDLAGGAMMDAGCYAVNALRLIGGEPKVSSARATLRSPGVDRAMTARLDFPDGATGELIASLWSRHLLGLSLRVTGDAGWLRVFNYLMPGMYHRLTWHSGGRTHRERVAGESTYTHQLRAFVSAVREDAPVPTSARDGVANMRVIDDIYRAAGLAPRK